MKPYTLKSRKAKLQGVNPKQKRRKKSPTQAKIKKTHDAKQINTKQVRKREAQRSQKIKERQDAEQSQIQNHKRKRSTREAT